MSTVAPAPTGAPAQAPTGPRTEHGKAVAARNATTHGLFARDIVLPALGEDPQSYRKLEAEWLAQLPPRSLLEQHYVEKIAAASWRLRRLHRWQAQLFEDDTLTEDQRLDKLDKVLRHETALHRQIDTAVKMLGKDVPQLYAHRVRDQVLEETMTSERECRESARDETDVDLETRGRLRRIRWATEAAVGVLSAVPLAAVPLAAVPPDTARDTNPHNTENGENEPSPCLSSPFLPREGAFGCGYSALAPGVGPTGVGLPEASPPAETDAGDAETEEDDDCEPDEAQNCQNEPRAWTAADRQAFLDSFASLNASGPRSAGRTRTTR